VDNFDHADQELVIDDMVHITHHGLDFYIYRYEASRPDATATSAGAQEFRPCSRAGVLPWANMSFADAQAACQAVGKRLCTAIEWEAACAGPDGWLYPYGSAYAADACNGVDYDGIPGGGDDDARLPAGSVSTCVSADGLFDMSGKFARIVPTICGGPHRREIPSMFCAAVISTRRTPALPVLLICRRRHLRFRFLRLVSAAVPTPPRNFLFPVFFVQNFRNRLRVRLFRCFHLKLENSIGVHRPLPAVCRPLPIPALRIPSCILDGQILTNNQLQLDFGQATGVSCPRLRVKEVFDMTKIAINGFGRIGRTALRLLAKRNSNLQVVAINDLTSPATLAHLFKYDSVHGTYSDVALDGDVLKVGKHAAKIFAIKNPAELPWKIWAWTWFGVHRDFPSLEKAQPHIDAGTKKVIISATGEQA
jgi:hypothetical protein